MTDATHLFRGNDKGEILDASGKVVGRIVPVEPSDEMIRANLDCQDYDPEDPAESEVYCLYIAMLSAAPADWSSVAVRVPENPFHKISSLHAAYQEALDAITGVK